MMNKKKISITAVLLAVMMMCLMPVRIFAADKKIVSVADALIDVQERYSDVQLSKYYFVAENSGSKTYCFYDIGKSESQPFFYVADSNKYNFGAFLMVNLYLITRQVIFVAVLALIRMVFLHLLFVAVILTSCIVHLMNLISLFLIRLILPSLILRQVIHPDCLILI